MAVTTEEIVNMPYDEAVIECIKKYHAIPTVKAMLTGMAKDISDPLIINKLHNAESSAILNASAKILSSIKLNPVQNFSMSPELANAIGTVVVQALQENAKSEAIEEGIDDSGDDFEENDIPPSSRDAGEVEQEEGPKYAPDLSAEVDELKNINNHSDNSRYEQLKRTVFNF